MTGIDSDTTIADTLREQAAQGSEPGAATPRGAGEPAAAGAPEPSGGSPETGPGEAASREGAAPTPGAPGGPGAGAGGSGGSDGPGGAGSGGSDGPGGPGARGGGPHHDAGASEDPGTEDEALGGDVKELIAVAAQRDEYLALAQRTQADFENYRKRVARDAAAAAERGAIKLARELLPALDNLDRAIDEAHSPGEGEAQEGPGKDPLLDGLRLVRSQLSGALSRVGIEEFSPLGEAFDPNRHEAMAQRPAVDGEPAGSVVEVYQSGYRLGESIIRPARVLVTS